MFYYHIFGCKNNKKITFSDFSVLWQTLRAAKTNPAEALKKE